MSSTKKSNKKSDGYKRKELLSAIDKPGENIAVLSKELKKLAAFMRNSSSKPGENEKIVTDTPEEIIQPQTAGNGNFDAIETFLANENSEEVSLDDILKSEGVCTDYFAAEATEDSANGNDEQITKIDSFLSSIEKMEFTKEMQPDENEDIDHDNFEEEEDKPIDESFYTESLASIYIKQKKYARALEIIRSISLKNPEKNIYFADQIRFLEKLIINVKSE